jgi:hypothetical protein
MSTYGRPSFTTGTKQENTTALIFTSFFLAVLFNGLASTGPILTTYGAMKKCEEPGADICEKDKTWYIIIGVILIVVALCSTSVCVASMRNQ